MIRTNPLCDNVKAEERNVTFRMEEEKNGKIVKSQPYQTKPTDLNNFEPHCALARTTFLVLRGSSYSLVELPTFLPPPYCVQTRPQCQCTKATNIDKSHTLAEVLADYHPSDTALLRPTSQWTVMIVAIIFFTTYYFLPHPFV